MQTRLSYSELSPDQMKKLVELGLTKSSLDHALKNLIDIRASQINGCTFCLDMHVKQAKLRKESELRLYHTAVWKESKLFTPKERAILEWTELVTKMDEKGISDEDYKKALEHLSEKELSDATFQIGIINLWNKLNVAFQTEPGILDKAYGLDKAGL